MAGDQGPSTKRLLELVQPYIKPLAIATGVVLLESGFSLAAPLVAGMVVDAALIEGTAARLNVLVLALLGIFVVRAVLSFAQTYIIRATGARFLQALRDRVFGHLVLLAPDFYEARRIGELLSRIGSDLSRVQTTLTTKVPDGIRSVIVFLGTLGILLWINVGLTLLTLLMVPPIVLLAMWYGRRLQKLAKKVQDALADTSASAEEALAGIRTVQAFGRQEHEASRYRSSLRQLLDHQIENARLVGLFGGIIQFVGFGAFAIVLWYGGNLILEKRLTAGELTSFILYAFAIAGSVGSLGSLYAGLRELRGASARVFEILDTGSSITDAPGAIPLSSPRGRLRLSNLSFRYPSAPDDRFALRDIDIDIAPGETVAVVGPSGAGKSTLFGLVLRFRDPTSGHIQIDGHDLRELTVDSVRGAIAVVPQEIFLFSGTIADNIRYGGTDPSDDDLRRAAKLAGAASFIEQLPQGYDEVVGERGVKLSAGQRQRIAIARAFLREPSILLLDEATSNLDADSEELVQKALIELMHDRTTLVIAHRLATARRADRIVVLDDGAIVASGTHDELFGSSELYRRYWELQSLDGAVAPPAAAPRADSA
jgi:subfamily B ATP-binding cassette protein MsbA